MDGLMGETDLANPVDRRAREYWRAVCQRDRSADGRFVYGVRSTGIYCRPSCGARRARRENVTFYADGAAAERAGFRPCKRCKPSAAAPQDERAARIAQACRQIEAAADMPDLDELAQAAGLSRFHFHRLFKTVTGVTPKAYGDQLRAQRVQAALAQGGAVTEAIYDAGFNSSGRFYADATARLGMTPSAYRAGGEGAAIRFAVGQCSLGAILVAASEKGVCAILLGDDPAALVDDLERRFRKATLIGGDRDFERWVALVVGFVEAPAKGLDLPLDLRGTAFQQHVWQALRDIPAGSTASYAEIAKRLGQPSAARAVAQACAANKVAVAIPCHRVVGQDGGLSGYRWGIARKRALLTREKAS